MKNFYLLFLLVLIPLLSYADAVEIDGIYYNLVKKAKIAEVTNSPKRYSGDVVIPEKVTFEDTEYNVTSIASSAFRVDGHDICLTSITIPKSITSIGKDAFMSFSTDIVNILDLESWCNISFANNYSNPLGNAGKLYVRGEEINEITIPNSLTSICNYAFSGCRSLKSVVIPNTITSIGNYSFAMCLGLTSIEIPISITSIGDYAFDGCTGLKSLTIPNSVTSIGNCAFASCWFLTSVSIPSSVKKIGYSAFSSCERLNSVHISDIESWCDINFLNELSNPLSYAHHIYLNDKELTDLYIPDNITTIRKYAFYEASSISSVTIPDGVTSIGDYAFKGCSNMSSVTIPKSVCSIGKCSFSACKELSDVYCYADNMPTLYSDVFLDSYVEYATLHVPDGSVDAYKAVSPWNGFKEIVPIQDTDLKEVIVDNLKYSYSPSSLKATVIQDASYNQLESVVIPASIKVDGVDYKVTAIGNYAFANCYNINSVTINADIESIGNWAFANVGMSELSLPSSLKFIGDHAFSICYLLASLVIPEGVETIGESAFYRCSQLRRLELPSTLTSIGEYVIENSSILCIVVSHMTDPINISDNTFLNHNITPSSPRLYVPAGTKSKYEKISGWTKFDEIVDGYKNEVKVGDLSYSYSTDFNTATVIPGDYSSLQSVTIPASIKVDDVDYKVIAIGNKAFIAYNNIMSVTINADLETIGINAFSSVKMSKLTLPASLKSIGAYAFSYCDDLTSLVIQEGFESIGDNAFEYCENLQRLELPSTLSSIGDFVIRGTKGLCTVISRAIDPINVNENTFQTEYSDGCRPSSAILFVPAGSKSKYMAISGWTKFAAIEEIPATEPITFGEKPITTYTANYNLDFSGTDDIKAYVATGYDYDTGTVWLTRVKDVPSGMPIMIMGTAKETYDIPVKLTSGTYFKNMFVGNTTGGTMTLPQTTGEMTNYYLSNGMFKTSTGSNTISAGKCYLQIPTVAPTPVEGSSCIVKMNDNGFASFSSSVDYDFTDVEGLKAYAATGYDDASGTIWLTRVKRVSAGTGLLLMGAAGGKYTIPSTSVRSYYANMMVGNTGTSDITIYTTSGDMTNYYLKGNQLLKADGDKGNPINPGKAYMQIPSAHVTRSIGDDPTENLSVYDLLELPEVISMQVMTRGIDGGDGDTTGIHEAVQTEQTNDVYYNLNGQRVNNPGKGLYIHNGKKVIVR